MAEKVFSTITVTKQAWQLLRDVADARGLKMYALASEIIREALDKRAVVVDGKLVANERKAQEG